MKIIKLKISLFNRYLIFLIILLFSYLFYLSIPVLYNYERLQKDLTTKLLEEFNINAALSGNITYKILPAPNFEITNTILSIDKKNESTDFGQVKKLKIFVSILKLFNQENLKIKKIVLDKSNFNFNKKTFNYISNYLSKKINTKKIEIRKSKIFFTEDNEKKNPLALYSIDKGTIFYDEKNNKNKLLINGSVYNTKSRFIFFRDFKKLRETSFELNFRQINAKFKNELVKISDSKKEYKGKMFLFLLNSDIKFDYNIKDNLILLSSLKKENENNKNYFKGKIITSPFFHNIEINLETLDIINLINNFSKIKVFLQKDILLHKNFNGKIIINSNNLSNMKIFDKALINLKFLNSKLIFDDTTLLSDKIGKLTFIDSKLEELDNKQIFKGKFLFEIKDEKKFYRKLQISKTNRIKIKNIYLEIEKNLDLDDFKINKFIINQKNKNNSLLKTIDLTEIFVTNEIKNLKNWIEFRNFSNQIFSEIN